MEERHNGWHDHVFDQDQKRPGEQRTLIVIALTVCMMTVEIAAGTVFGSMALLADGLHMASHAVALGVNAFAYRYARLHARDRRFSFGMGKVNALGGFCGAVLLAVFAGLMAWESLARLVRPVEIVFNQAILVALLGLLANGVSVLILGASGSGGKEHRHDHDDHHDHDHDDHVHDGRHDHNLKAAYLHVLADTLTSILAIVALLAAKHLGAVWMDPLMGVAGAALVAMWSFGLLRATSLALLDRQAPEAICQAVTLAIEGEPPTCRIADLHVWSIGPKIYAAAITIVAASPLPPDEYRARIPTRLGVAHLTIEVQPVARRGPTA